MSNPQRTFSDTGDYLDRLDTIKYNVIAIGNAQSVTGATCAVAIASLVATDIVNVQTITQATAAYVLTVAKTAGTGFVVSYNTSPGTGTFDYTVIRAITI